jgi:hypothetical protein
MRKLLQAQTLLRIPNNNLPSQPMAPNNHIKKLTSLLAELEKLIKKLGLKVSSGKLVFAGLKLKGGQCLLRRDNWLILDRLQPLEDQLEVYRNALKSLEIPEHLFLGLSEDTASFVSSSHQDELNV